jgi:glycosyltransferase involved in cell wall biosynthesis
MRILSLSTCPLDPTLGSGKTRLRWSEGLRSLGHLVEVFEPKDYEAWFGMTRALRFRQAWGASLLVKEKLRGGGYDLVEFFGGEFGLVTRQISKLRNRPLIIAHTDGLELLASQRERAYNPPASFKGNLRAWFSRQTHERLSNAAFVYADAFVTGCELDREFVLKLSLYTPDKAAVVEPGLDTEYLSMPFSSAKQERIAYLGSWISRKGTNTLSAVMARVLKQQPQIFFDVYGTGGPPGPVLACFPSELHERISVYPRLTNQELATGLAKAKVFFFPTQYEGFGMALAEAMACSCAVVTTRTGLGAALRNKQEALLCDFNDADAMEQSILDLLQDEDQRLRIARGGWERVRGLVWEPNIRKLESLYKKWTLEKTSAQKLNESDAEPFRTVATG